MSALQLETAATILGPVLNEVVFVGGATVHLWLTEPGAPPARATEDVDVVCEVRLVSSTTGSVLACASEVCERHSASRSFADGEVPTLSSSWMSC